MIGLKRTTHINTWLSDFLNLLSPRFCPTCGRKLSPGEQLLCSFCLIQLPYVTIHDFRENLITRLFYGVIPVERGYSYIHYRTATMTHTLLVKLKYQHRPDIGFVLGKMMAQELVRQGFFEDIDAIVAVPLHWRRQLKRGYNQSEQIALGIASVTQLPTQFNLVKRIYNNSTQTDKNALERRENVESIFQAKTTSLRHILLVDDVLTTGSTLSACAQAIARENPDIKFSILSLAKA